MVARGAKARHQTRSTEAGAGEDADLARAIAASKAVARAEAREKDALERAILASREERLGDEALALALEMSERHAGAGGSASSSAAAASPDAEERRRRAEAFDFGVRCGVLRADGVADEASDEEDADLRAALLASKRVTDEQQELRRVVEDDLEQALRASEREAAERDVVDDDLEAALAASVRVVEEERRGREQAKDKLEQGMMNKGASSSDEDTGELRKALEESRRTVEEEKARSSQSRRQLLEALLESNRRDPHVAAEAKCESGASSGDDDDVKAALEASRRTLEEDIALAAAAERDVQEALQASEADASCGPAALGGRASDDLDDGDLRAAIKASLADDEMHRTLAEAAERQLAEAVRASLAAAPSTVCSTSAGGPAQYSLCEDDDNEDDLVEVCGAAAASEAADEDWADCLELWWNMDRPGSATGATEDAGGWTLVEEEDC